MKKKGWILILLIGIFPGCTGEVGNFILARLWVVKAESAHGTAYSLKFKKASYEERLRHYRIACGYYYQAYLRDPGAFTLNRIHDGVDSCWRVQDKEKEEALAAFEESYGKAHPKEFEYGDTDATIPE